MAVREELDSVDVGFVGSKGLDSLSSADIPELGESIASTGDEGVLVSRVETDAHDVAQVVGELSHLLTSLNIPLHASHVARRGEDATIVDEATAGQVASMAGELTSDTGRTIALLVEVVNRADVVETTTGDEVARWSVGTGHNP